MLRSLTRVRLPADPLERANVLLVRMLAALVVLVAVTYLAAYADRWDTVNAQRGACESRKLDQVSVGVAWAAATIARKADDRPVSRREVAAILDVPDRTLERWGVPVVGTASEVYGGAAQRLGSRSREDCTKRYGSPSLIPFG